MGRRKSLSDAKLACEMGKMGEGNKTHDLPQLGAGRRSEGCAWNRTIYFLTRELIDDRKTGRRSTMKTGSRKLSQNETIERHKSCSSPNNDAN